jgi:hypothetical protein
MNCNSWTSEQNWQNLSESIYKCLYIYKFPHENCGSKEVLLFGACPMFPKKLLMGQSILLLKKKREKVVGTTMIWLLRFTHYVLKISPSIIIKDSFFTICPYPDSYFLRKIWVMPKHIWTLNYYTCFGCVMNLGRISSLKRSHTFYWATGQTREKNCRSSFVLFSMADSPWVIHLMSGWWSPSQEHDILETIKGPRLTKEKKRRTTHYVLKISSSIIIIKDSFFTICPYPDSYFFKKIWVMPKHIWTLN